ncbi:hypothetical protein PIB30_071066 [Stylosanthes scabra]|uniref:R13L1/DRL21-like LRR repeat region domain-containing protein n=1 Tax=Stylosanthes scabra TaxID=79078 RepID=A0ABU6SQC9_9FABA|nr:hypothetical protein [Stylosanthes scabra]
MGCRTARVRLYMSTGARSNNLLLGRCHGRLLLSLLLKGIAAAPPDKFGETLQDEGINGGAFAKFACKGGATTYVVATNPVLLRLLVNEWELVYFLATFAIVLKSQRDSKENREEPTRAEMFTVTRTSKKGKEVDAKTQAVIEEIQHRIEAGEDDEDAFTLVLGKDQPGRLRCYGGGITKSSLKKDEALYSLLNIYGTKLEEMPKRMSKLKDLQYLSNYVVGKHQENGVGELGELAHLYGRFWIEKLENVVDSNEAWKARLIDKKYISDLKEDVDFQIANDALAKLEPHSDLKNLIIVNYSGSMLPDWLGKSSYHNMTKLELWECRNCTVLPSFGQLPSLMRLELFGFDMVKKI